METWLWNPPPRLTPKPSSQPKDPTAQGTSLKAAVGSCGQLWAAGCGEEKVLRRTELPLQSRAFGPS